MSHSIVNEARTISASQRQEQLQLLVRQWQRVTVGQICEYFGVSEATARRDLNVLAEKGEIRRFHGGGTAIFRAPPEPPIMERSAEQIGFKQRIGRAAAGLVSNGETVLLGSGTTVLEVALNLTKLSDLTVITNSVLVVNALSDAAGITLIGLGGMFRRSEKSFIGDMTIQMLSELRADKVFMGVRALDPDVGLTNDYVPETTTARALLSAGNEVIVTADHTKCGRVATAFVAPTTAMTTLVTNSEIAPDYIKAFRANGVRVVTA